MSDGKDSKVVAKGTQFRLSLVLLLIGLCVLVYVAILNHNYAYLVGHGVRTTGNIVGCINMESDVPNIPTLNNRHLWLPVIYGTRCYEYGIQFRTTKGKLVEISAGPNVDRWAQNGNVSVLYLPNDPEKTALIEDNSTFGLFIIGVIFCIEAAVFFLVINPDYFRTSVPKRRD